MKYFTVDTDPEFPLLIKEKELPIHLNAWVSPSGDFYGFSGSKHLRVATYIAIVLLNIHPDDLRKGTYFNESFDSRLLSLGWLEIKDTSWLDGDIDPKFSIATLVTQKQMDVIFDYCEKHGIEYPFKN